MGTKLAVLDEGTYVKSRASILTTMASYDWDPKEKQS